MVSQRARMMDNLFREEAHALIWPIRFIRFTLDRIEWFETPIAAGRVPWPGTRVR